jgi:predicted transcriptional regulator
MTKTTIYLKPETLEALRRMAKGQGRTQSELIRDALDEYTRKPRLPRIPGLGEFDSGETHGAERAKDFLRSAAEKGRWLR